MTKFIKIRNSLTVILLLGAIIWSFSGNQFERRTLEVQDYIWNSGWSQIYNEEKIVLSSADEFQEVEVGETLVLTNIIPYLSNDKVLVFYSKDLEVKIYVGEEEIYNFEMQEEFEFLQTPGHMWNEVIIPASYAGETLRIELTSQFDERFMSTVTKLYLVDGEITQTIILKEDGFRLLMCIVIFGITILCYLNMIIWKRREIKKYFYGLGTLYLSVTLWLFGMTGIFTYIWNQPIVNLLICNLMVPLLPVTVYEFYKIIYNKQNRIFQVTGIVVWSNFFIQYILQFGFGISILTMLPLSYAVYAIGAVVVLLLLIHYTYQFRKSGRKIQEVDFALMSTWIIFAATIIEIIILLVFPERTDLIGRAGIIGIILYMMINMIALSYFEAKIDIEKLRIEEEYNQLQNVTLVHQIKAHFFYNTLNNISALCKTDAAKADRAIVSFSQYMHSYMYLINEKKNIPITQEIDLIKTSLEIEQIRFPDTFDFNIELEYADFKIPPLSIQPLIENALYHGIRRSTKHGELSITTKKAYGNAEIIISDNGVGFDVSILEKSASIGLQNLKKRIEIMANGSVEIESIIDEGTKITIKVPLK